MSSSAFRECDAEDDDDELLDEEEEEEEEEEKEETRKKLDAVLGEAPKTQRTSAKRYSRHLVVGKKSRGRARDVDKRTRAFTLGNDASILRICRESGGFYGRFNATRGLRRGVCGALKALATRTRTLRMRAELLEKMCEEKGIITATPEKKGWNSGLSPLNAIGGGFSSLSPMRVFRSGSASPKKKNTPPASPSRKSKLNNDGPFAVTATKTKKEEEEEGRRRTRRSSRQRKRHRRRRQKSLVRLFLRLLLSRRLPRRLRPPRTPLQSIGNRIAYVRKRKTRHLQRRSTLLTSSSPSSNGKKSNS